MYLYKCERRVWNYSNEEWDVKDYRDVNKAVEFLKKEDGAKTFNGFELIPYEFCDGYSIMKEIGYWRKANEIHNWFVNNVQMGVDECQLSIVTKEKLEELLSVCKEVNEELDVDVAKELLPTQSGFFFGGTDYNEWYYADIEKTIYIIENVLSNTNFEKEVVFYQSSW